MTSDPPNVRRQLTLFATGPAAEPIERMRARLDPVQHRLIRAHVTLCREDDFGDHDVAELTKRLRWWDRGPLRLTFGAPESFSTHGVLLPCVDGEPAFHELRAIVLHPDDPWPLTPHLTLAHPRNPRAEANVPDAWPSLDTPITLTFDTISLIEQVDGGVWCRLEDHPLDHSA